MHRRMQHREQRPQSTRSAVGSHRHSSRSDKLLYGGGKGAKKATTTSTTNGSWKGEEIVNGVFMCNRKRKPLCQAYNSANGCNWTFGNSICGYDNLSLHLCNKCLSPQHSGGSCNVTPKVKSNRGKKGSKGGGRRQF